MLRALQHITLAFSAILLLMLVSCAPSPSAPIREGNRYATGFELRQQEDSTVELVIYSPWHPTQVMGLYSIRLPYRRIVSNSCTHVGYLKELGALSSLVGITDRHLVYTPLPDSVVDLGNSMSPNEERIVLSQPDLILLTAYQSQSTTQLAKPTKPVQPAKPVYINEWQETHPLARAEWIRVFGALTGRLEEADSIFSIVCDTYHQLTDSPIHQESSCSGSKPANSLSLLSGQDFRGTWYVPAGGTYMGQLFRDAGYTYRYADDARTQSIPLTTEQVIREFQQADIWVGVQASSLAELAQIDEKHTWFKAYQTDRVYSFAKRATATGGNDFWETGAVHPERILRDFLLIRQSAPSDSLYFLRHLSN